MYTWLIKYLIVSVGVPVILQIIAENTKPKTSKEKEELGAAIKQFNETINRKQAGR
jgi:hypothetical protein